MGRVSPLASLFGVISLLQVATACPHAHAQEWQQLPEKVQVAVLEGQRVTIVIRPEVQFSDSNSGGINMNARARASLGDLQAKSPDILRAFAADKSNCGLRLNFPDLSPAVVQGAKLKIGGQVHAEQWLCSGPLKTFLVEATADFTVALRPVSSEREVALSAELERFDVNGALSGLSGELKQILSSFLRQMVQGDGMKFKFPAEIANLNPRFTDVQLVDVGNGSGELDIQATALVHAADMARILALIMK